VLLPFIDMRKLKNTITPIFSMLGESEQERNSYGEILLYCKTVSNEIFVQFVNSTP